MASMVIVMRRVDEGDLAVGVDNHNILLYQIEQYSHAKKAVSPQLTSQ